MARACSNACSLKEYPLLVLLLVLSLVHGVQTGVRLRSVFGMIVRFVQYLCEAMASSKRVGIIRNMHIIQVVRVWNGEGMNITIVRSFYRSEIVNMRLVRTVRAAAATEQVSTLHNATAYVEGIHFGSCFRQVNTHAPYPSISKFDWKINPKEKKPKKSFQSKFTSFSFSFFVILIFRFFVVVVVHRTCSTAFQNRNQLYSGPATIRLSLREQKKKEIK